MVSIGKDTIVLIPALWLTNKPTNSKKENPTLEAQLIKKFHYLLFGLPNGLFPLDFLIKIVWFFIFAMLAAQPDNNK
jgi:hypothetical protein